MIETKENRELNALKMEFSLSEAYETLEMLINKKINDHKVAYWTKWEKNHDADRSEIDMHIESLEEQKAELKKMFSMNNKTRQDLSLEASLSVKPATA